MPKLHELLAAEGTLGQQAEKTRADLENTFEKKQQHFIGQTVLFQPVEEGKQPVEETNRKIQTTVRKELRWIAGILTPVLDTGFQIDKANTQAVADIELEDGTVLAKNVPTTALLRLEHRMDEILKLAAKIPTLDPLKNFEPDKAAGEGIYRARDEVKTRGRKVPKVIVKYPHTEQHPAQTELITLDEPAGTVTTSIWSGELSVADKGDLLERCEKLRVAIKKARARANGIEVSTQDKIGSTLLNYVFNG